MKNRFFLIVFFIFSTFLFSQEKINLTIFHAGSLAKPFKDLKSEFEKQNPNVTILLESAGSIECARKITELKRECDVFASADEFVISNYLIPVYASWSINFVTNEMVIMFTKNSKFNKDINSNNWYEILTKKGVEYGHSDPNKDPCGYRTLQVWQLAEIYYKKDGLYTILFNNCPVKNIRPKEVDMLSLLETNEIDYLFIYKSVAVQHNALYVKLPDKINLSKEENKEFYKNAVVKITGKTIDEKIDQIGAPIVYSMTIPKNAINNEWALKFIEFVIGEQGRKIMEKNGHIAINPVTSKYYNILPEKLKKYAKEF